MNTNQTKRIRELIEQSIEDNFTLAYPPEIIVHMEDHGHIIDLVTGQLIENGATHRIYPTTAAEAEHYVATLTGGL